MREKTFILATPPAFVPGLRLHLPSGHRRRIHLSVEVVAPCCHGCFSTEKQEPGRHFPKPTWRVAASNKAPGANFATASTCTQQPGPDMPTNSNSDASCREGARHPAHQNESPAARQALTAGPTAPGTAATLAQLQDPQRRPPDPYQPLPHDLLQYQPAAPLRLLVARTVAPWCGGPCAHNSHLRQSHQQNPIHRWYRGIRHNLQTQHATRTTPNRRSEQLPSFCQVMVRPGI